MNQYLCQSTIELIPFKNIEQTYDVSTTSLVLNIKRIKLYFEL